MQILVVSLLIIALIIYVIYKIKKSFSKKELVGFSIFFIGVIALFIVFNTNKEQKLPNAFKNYYLKEKNTEILKLTINRANLEVLSSSKTIYNMAYIIKKDDKEFVCEANDIEVQQIEDEYIFKNFKDKCVVK